MERLRDLERQAQEFPDDPLVFERLELERIRQDYTCPDCGHLYDTSVAPCLTHWGRRVVDHARGFWKDAVRNGDMAAIQINPDGTIHE